jgi:hypothetical protein
MSYPKLQPRSGGGIHPTAQAAWVIPEKRNRVPSGTAPTGSNLSRLLVYLSVLSLISRVCLGLRFLPIESSAGRTAKLLRSSLENLESTAGRPFADNYGYGLPQRNSVLVVICLILLDTMKNETAHGRQNASIFCRPFPVVKRVSSVSRIIEVIVRIQVERDRPFPTVLPQK